jgi:hypothetical protein
MPPSDPIIAILAQFQPVFTAPTWKKLMTLLTGTLLARGRRTVTAALRQTGHHLDSNLSTFHQVLNRARWSPMEVSRHLLSLIVETFVQAGNAIDRVIDEPLERRWGAKISKRGHSRDSALSSHKRSVSSPGLRWIVMAVVVTLPWTQQKWALPFLCVLTTTPEVSEKLGKRHKTVGIWAQQMVSLVRRWLATVPLKLIGDTAYSILELGLHCVAHHVTLIAPFRLDAVIHQPASARTKHTNAASARCRQTAALSRAGPARFQDGVATHHRGLVWGRETDSGDMHRNSVMGPLWVDPLADPLGPHS